MTHGAFYNENDPKAAAWLRELIKAGHIAPGIVDERSITELKPDDLHGYTQCHFFAGIGGWSLALRMAGVPDQQPLWTGSCPCQPFSAAGKQLGTDDERHLWPAWFRLIMQCQPAILLGEQVASKAALGWLDGVFADLEDSDYACGAADLCAAGVGAPHIRQRLFWLAHTGRLRDESHRLTRNALGPRGEVEGEEEQRERSRVAVGCGGENGRLGNTKGFGWDSCRDNDHAAKRAASAAGVGGVACGVAIPDGGDTGEEREQRSGEQRQQPQDSGAGERLGHAECPEGARLGRDGWQVVSGEQEPSGCDHSNPWSRYELLPCADGKARRIEPGTFPLAHGIPGRMGLLRGYGNAIVPQVAAQFIQAAFEAIAESTP